MFDAILDVDELGAAVEAILEAVLELYDGLVGVNVGHYALVEDALALDRDQVADELLRCHCGSDVSLSALVIFTHTHGLQRKHG